MVMRDDHRSVGKHALLHVHTSHTICMSVLYYMYNLYAAGAVLHTDCNYMLHSKYVCSLGVPYRIYGKKSVVRLMMHHEARVVR